MKINEMTDMMENGKKREVVMIRGKVVVRNMIEMIDMMKSDVERCRTMQNDVERCRKM